MFTQIVAVVIAARLNIQLVADIHEVLFNKASSKGIFPKESELTAPFR